MKVTQHVPGGVPEYKDVQEEVEQNFYMSRMEPAMREYLTKMREDAYIDVKPGFTDSGASPRQTKPVYSAYTPPAPKKKKKVERTRFRETTRTFRQKSPQASTAPEPASPPAPAAKKGKQNASADTTATMKPGKKEKIRFGRAPTKTLPSAPETMVENAGALPPETASNAQEPVNPLEAAPAAPEKKTRYSARAKQPKQPKAKGPQPDAMAPAAPDAAEVADRQTQAGPLGLAGDTAAKKKKKATTAGDKTRLANKTKKTETPQGDVPLAPAPQAPTPAPQPQ
jgi:peptidyl-prolyl cis-trans isomerase SurA